MDSQVLLGDCLNLMRNITDKSIDMVLCDLPYGTTKCPWDTQIDLDELWKHYNRICKDSCAIVLFSQSPFDKVLACSNISQFRYEWIWEKPTATGFFNAKKMPLKAHENILVFYKELPTYNPQKTFGHNPINSFVKKTEVADKTEIYGKNTQDIIGGGNTDRYPRSVLKFSTDTQKNKNSTYKHPTQKPLGLTEYLIKTYTNENDIVLDNCAGSGTTLVAAKKLKRKYIGIEKEQKYYDMILDRLNNTLIVDSIH